MEFVMFPDFCVSISNSHTTAWMKTSPKLWSRWVLFVQFLVWEPVFFCILWTLSTTNERTMYSHTVYRPVALLLQLYKPIILLEYSYDINHTNVKKWYTKCTFYECLTCFSTIKNKIENYFMFWDESHMSGGCFSCGCTN